MSNLDSVLEHTGNGTVLQSSSTALHVTFKTDLSQTGGGVHIQYQQIQRRNMACTLGRYIYLNSDQPYQVTSPNYNSGEYKTNQRCSWKIKSIGSVVQFTNLHVHLNGVEGLVVYDGYDANFPVSCYFNGTAQCLQNNEKINVNAYACDSVE